MDAPDVERRSQSPIDPSRSRRRARRARRAVLLLVLVGAVFAWAISRVLIGAGKLEASDFNHFYHAAEAMRLGEDIYRSWYGGYLYPPLLAWALQPLVGTDARTAFLVWDAATLAMFACCLAISMRTIARALELSVDLFTTGAVSLLSLLLATGPLRAVLELGQTDALVLLGLCVALALVSRRPAAGGAALALALMVKHQVLLFFPYLLVRRRFGAVVGLAVASGVLAFVPALQIGLGRTAEYLGTSYGYIFSLLTGSPSPPGIHIYPVTWSESVSVTSAIARFNDSPEGPDMFVALGLVVLVAAVVFGVTWKIYASHGVSMFVRRTPRADNARPSLLVLEWCGLLVAICAFSPQTMIRHTLILLPVHVLASFVLITRRRGVTRWPLLTSLVLFVLASRLPPGEEPFEEALRVWRHVGGASWFLLLYWLGLVWTTLSFAHAGERENV